MESLEDLFSVVARGDAQCFAAVLCGAPLATAALVAEAIVTWETWQVQDILLGDFLGRRLPRWWHNWNATHTASYANYFAPLNDGFTLPATALDNLYIDVHVALFSVTARRRTLECNIPLWTALLLCSSSGPRFRNALMVPNWGLAEQVAYFVRISHTQSSDEKSGSMHEQEQGDMGTVLAEFECARRHATYLPTSAGVWIHVLDIVQRHWGSSLTLSPHGVAATYMLALTHPLLWDTEDLPQSLLECAAELVARGGHDTAGDTWLCKAGPPVMRRRAWLRRLDGLVGWKRARS